MTGSIKRGLLLWGALLLASCGSPQSPLPPGVETTLRNPILPGFHPDPSVVAVGEDYYLINSSFQYFPGVPIYHSRDLQNWEQIGNVLDRPSQVDLTGATSWTGIYAPTIRYNDGVFYMITTNVSGGGNFMVTATDPAGPWSEPLSLEQQGIDPSLYFEDGVCYMVSNPEGTITLCEIDPATGATLSPGKALWKGTGGRFPEGPHIYRKDGWYYLLISEGGTELAHKLTVARSRKIYGPYEAFPGNPIFTHCSAAGQESPIQGTGHGDLFQASDGSWWMVFLAYRRCGGDFHHLGRETFLAPVTWENGWPVVNGGVPVAEEMTVRMPARAEAPASRTRHYRFDGAPGPEWMHIQAPRPENYSTAAGGLLLHGTGKGLEPGSGQPTALLRRQESVNARFGAPVRLSGDGEAGIALYQIDGGYATLSVRKQGGKSCAVVHFRIRSLEKDEAVVPLPEGKAHLEIVSRGDLYTFCVDGREVARLGSPLLSTEVVGGFTGITVGPYCREGDAVFESFDYEED